jgi:hypothetical protein
MKKLHTTLLIFFIINHLIGQADELPFQPSCNIVSLDSIASILEIDTMNITQQDLNFRTKTSLCYNIADTGVRKLTIRSDWKTPQEIQNKLLENNYVKYLAEGDKYVQNYQEVTSSIGTQTLFGTGLDENNNHIHIIRRRYDNNSEIRVEMIKEVLDANAETDLLSIIDNV